MPWGDKFFPSNAFFLQNLRSSLFGLSLNVYKTRIFSVTYTGTFYAFYYIHWQEFPNIKEGCVMLALFEKRFRKITKNMSKLTLNIFFCLFVFSAALSPYAQGGQNEWTTVRIISPQTTLRYHWVRADGGLETVTLIEAIQNKQVIKYFAISGQPVFNETITRVAFPDCWNGGCSKIIRILDLSTLSELAPVQFDKESFLAVSWENERRLKVERAPVSFDGKIELKVFEVN
jgi:hypothetical protein